MGIEWVIRVGVVDDHPVVSDGFRAGLSRAADIAVAWSARTLAEARERLASGDDADVILLDVRLPDGRGFELLPRGSRDRPVFLVMSSFDRPLYAARAFQDGASGFLLKTAPMEDIHDAIRRAATGGLVFEARHLEALRLGPSLTPREQQVVRLVALSYSNDEIAASLRLSTKTVEAYLSEIFRRHGFTTRTELAVWAEREGWLEEL